MFPKEQGILLTESLLLAESGSEKNHTFRPTALRPAVPAVMPKGVCLGKEQPLLCMPLSVNNITKNYS